MSSDSSMNQKEFWNTVKYLTKLDHPKAYSQICQDLSVTPAGLNSHINFLKGVGYSLEVEENLDGIKSVRPPEEKPLIEIKCTLYDWLQFQSHFPALAKATELPCSEDFKNKIAEVESTYSQHDLFEPLNALDEIMHHQKPTLIQENSFAQSELVGFIEESIIDKQSLYVKLEQSSMSVYPHTLIYLEGELSVVAENISDGSLLNIPVSHIESINEDESEHVAKYSLLEINDFVASVRSIHEQETRLILKINGLANFENSIPRNFLGNPAMITNSDGDLIWGATVESNIEIFNWLFELGQDVEILDPTDFKKEYLNYCEDKLKKLA